jgi:hypothetical protein
MPQHTLTNKLAAAIAEIFFRHKDLIYNTATPDQLITPTAVATLTKDFLAAGHPPAAISELDEKPYYFLHHQLAEQIAPISRRYRNNHGWHQYRALLEATHTARQIDPRLRPDPEMDEVHAILTAYQTERTTHDLPLNLVIDRQLNQIAHYLAHI